MKRKQFFSLVLLTALGLSSCTVYRHTEVTGNPVGTKQGVARGSIFNPDISLQTAAKNGNITKIGSVEVTYKTFILPFYKTVVTGE
jgi:hypothetical protein